MYKFGSDFHTLACLLDYSRYCLIYEKYFPFNIAVLKYSLNPLKVNYFYQHFNLTFSTI